MKGIVLAGGTGTRLYPMTIVVNKQLLPIYDKPMIYYSIGTLMLAGIREILVISSPEGTPLFRKLLGDGEKWGVSFSYAVQASPGGLPQAFIIGKDFIGNNPVCLILGDNIFYGTGLRDRLEKAATKKKGGTAFAYIVSDPERYGVVTFDSKGRVINIEEKPADPTSNMALTGLYFFDSNVVSVAQSLSPSKRGELEITDVLRYYLELDLLEVEELGRGTAWMDAGTPETMLQAGSFIYAIEERQGLKISCPEEIAYRLGYIDSDQLKNLVGDMAMSEYGEYFLRLLDRE